MLIGTTMVWEEEEEKEESLPPQMIFFTKRVLGRHYLTACPPVPWRGGRTALGERQDPLLTLHSGGPKQNWTSAAQFRSLKFRMVVGPQGNPGVPSYLGGHSV